jgi:hypothetical protein
MSEMAPARFRCLDLRLCGLQPLLGLIVVRARRPTLSEKRLLTLVVISRLRQLCLGCRQVRLGGAQCVQFVLRFKARNQLIWFDPVSDLKFVFENPAGNSE